MTKKIVVAGCRNYNNYEQAREYIDLCLKNLKKEYNLVFLSGTCRGADILGERYAKENGYAIERYPADWENLGKSAGPVRNKKMAEVGDFFICFWDNKSKGTKSLIDYAYELGKEVRVKIIK